MDATFVWNGKRMNRLQMVQKQLKSTIDDQLKPYQRFNIVAFQSQLVFFKSNVVNATRQTIDVII